MVPTRLWLLAAAAIFASSAAAVSASETPGLCWTGTWASSQQVPEEHNALGRESLDDATLRQIVRTTIGGDRIRLRLSNLFGTEPLRLRSVRVAASADPGSPRIVDGSDRTVTFGGSDSVLIPAGAEALSDPVDLTVAPMSHLAISFHLPDPPERQTSHPGSRATSYFVAGDRSAAVDLPGAGTVTHWYQLGGVDVATACGAVAAIVTLGDSITDGFGVAPDSDTRWPDFLARRLRADPRTGHLAVLNHGIGGNRLLRDGLGPNTLARFDRDVLLQPGARFLILLVGVNDLGVFAHEGPATPEAHRALVANMIGAYRQMVARARERRIMAIGATLPPIGGSDYLRADPAIEADRQTLNAWIRTPGHFDAVIDFDAALRDPADPTRMRADVNSGDGLHPSIAGYEAMARAVDLGLFVGE
ncbi:SGNH/GDSL hydrolase family protein [Sphingosinicella sp. CPCC 101087]|uniref:SGNH/GDSL hydrolase family protein n=1 Tax=Sphingosinicella sp. CPCC 101087 TaxID=2497754 RepID=UPI00101E0B07|nr:SGNH/GDSL hydrolase family protein [Sphingosinicella sp. CPCC 101087]